MEARDDRANAEPPGFEPERDEDQHPDAGDNSDVDRAVAEVSADLRADRLDALHRGEAGEEILLERVADLRIDAAQVLHFAQIADQAVARLFTVIDDALRDIARLMRVEPRA